MNSSSVTSALAVVNSLIAFGTVALAVVQLRKFRNSRGIDFVLEAESSFDSVRHSLIFASPDVIRRAYKGQGLESLSDEDVQVYPYMRSLSVLVSRMYFILSSESLDIGLDEYERQEMIRTWRRYLELYKDDPVMRLINDQNQLHRDRNSRFLDLAAEIFDS